MHKSPRTLGEFEILRRIGEGGMAEVFLAEKRGAEGTSKRIVVKRIPRSQQQDRRLYAMFVREARLATGLDHPNIVHVYELVDHPEDGLLLAMEYVDGVDLAHMLRAAKRRGESIPPYVAALIAREAAKGLHHAHECKGADGSPLEIVHRDVSPQNILVSRHGTVKIADLGIATARLYRDATTGLKGKFRYMAPEQVAGAVLDRRADLYALGVVLYEMLRLESPYGMYADALLEAVRVGLFDPPLDEIKDIPADLLAILRRALALDPAARYQTARELADDLSRVLVAQGRVIDEVAIAALVGPALEAPPESAPGDATETAVEGKGARNAPLAVGAKLGRYLIEARLGRGGMADVYAARDTTLDREVALKVLRGSTNQRTKNLLLREAKVSARFEHPGSVVIYDVGEIGNLGFIAMELVRGTLLSELIGNPDVPLHRRVRWLVGVARVLAAAHAAGLVHRDIKPSNLMVRENGDVKVLDFGIARAFSGRSSGAGEPSEASSFVGTLRYAAPERFGDAPASCDGRSDQFSWGITAWELFAGRHPWDDAVETGGPVPAMFSEGAPPLATRAPDVPEAIARIIDRTLAKRPADRFATMDEVADELEAFAEASVSSRPSRTSMMPESAPVVEAPHPAAPPKSPPRRPRLLLVALGVVAALGLAMGAKMTGSPGHSSSMSSTSASASSGPALEAAAPVIEALGCSDATVEGEGGEGLAHAIGMAACARLAPAIGVDWAAPTAQHRLAVHAELQPGRAVVTLKLAGREATGTGPKPIAAIWSAVSALASQLPATPWPPERVRLWGARDEVAARRIFRVWRYSTTNLSPNISAEVAGLLQTDADSPMPHLLALITSTGGPEALAAAPARIAERLDRVPPARADAIRAVLAAFPAERDRKEAVRLFRKSYAAAPQDHAMISLYAAMAVRLALPEAHGIIERLYRDSPTFTLGPISNSFTRAAYLDPLRNDTYLTRLSEFLPEALGRKEPVQHLIARGRFADARGAIDLARRLGLDGAAGDPSVHESALAQIEIAALSPAAAREHTTVVLADPRGISPILGGLSLSASYMMEGRVAEALSAMRQSGEYSGAAIFDVAALRLLRWLRLPPAPALEARLGRFVSEGADLPPLTRLEAQVELGLVGPRKAAEEALRALEDAAAHAGDDEPMVRDRALVVGVPLMRVVRGDRAAAALWERTTHAPDVARCSAAFDAALALEAVGDVKGAEAAYLLAEKPGNNVEYTGQRMLAMARLVRLYRQNGRASEAAEREAILERLWAHADGDLRKAIEGMR